MSFSGEVIACATGGFDLLYRRKVYVLYSFKIRKIRKDGRRQSFRMLNP